MNTIFRKLIPTQCHDSINHMIKNKNNGETNEKEKQNVKTNKMLQHQL